MFYDIGITIHAKLPILWDVLSPRLLQDTSPLSSSVWPYRVHGNSWISCSQVEAMAYGKHWLRPSLCRITASHHFCATVAAICICTWGSPHPGVPYGSGTHVCSSFSLPFFLPWELEGWTGSLFCDPGNFLTLVSSSQNLLCHNPQSSL